MAPVARSGVLSVDDQDEVGGAHAQESLENYQRTLEVDLSRRTESYEMREQEYQEAIAELEDELDASRRGEHRAPAWGLAEFDEEPHAQRGPGHTPRAVVRKLCGGSPQPFPGKLRYTRPRQPVGALATLQITRRHRFWPMQLLAHIRPVARQHLPSQNRALALLDPANWGASSYNNRRAFACFAGTSLALAPG